MNSKLFDILTRPGFRSHFSRLQPQRMLFLPWQHEEPSKTDLMSADKFWKDIGNRIKRLDEELKTVAKKIGGNNGRGKMGMDGTTWPFSREVYRTLFAVPEIIEGEDKKKYYMLEIPIGKQFVPDNVKIVMKNYNLTVTAVVEDKSADGKQHFYTEIKRQITLPDYVDLESVKSVMGKDGVLKIEAPVLPGIEPPSTTKEIQIKHIR